MEAVGDVGEEAHDGDRDVEEQVVELMVREHELGAEPVVLNPGEDVAERTLVGVLVEDLVVGPQAF